MNPFSIQPEQLCTSRTGRNRANRTGAVEAAVQQSGLHRHGNPDVCLVSDQDRRKNINRGTVFRFGKRQYGGNQRYTGVSVRPPMPVIHIRTVSIRCIDIGSCRSRQLFSVKEDAAASIAAICTEQHINRFIVCPIACPSCGSRTDIIEDAQPDGVQIMHTAVVFIKSGNPVGKENT